MITTVGKAKEKLCVVPGLTETGRCVGLDCMAWHYWMDPRETMGGKTVHNSPGHGKANSDKSGYCGRAGIH